MRIGNFDFKVWDRFHKKWIDNSKGSIYIGNAYPYVLHCEYDEWFDDEDGEDNYSITVNGFNGGSFLELVQYTGLKDKNEVKIYEGDICQYSNGYSDMVVWGESGFKWNKRPLHRVIKQIEVIGNIYENPEFLPTQTPDHSPIADEFIFDMTKTQCEKTPGYENLYEVSNKDAFRSSKNYYCTQCKKLVGGAHMHATNGTNNKTLPTQPDDHE